jgi:hypothetical protein
VAADGKVRIELTLTRTEGMSKIGSRAPHKLGVDVPFYDTRPPSSVPRAALNSVLLTVVIGQRLRSIKTYDAFDKHDDHSALFSDGANPHADEPKAVMALSDRTGDNEIADDMFFATEPGNEAIADREEDMPVKSKDGGDSRIRELLRLLDASVRRSISASVVTNRHVSIQVDRSFQSLCTVAPTVFRAGHLPAVASRALFLHTISKSIGAVTSRCAPSKTSETCNRDCLSCGVKSSFSLYQQESVANESSELIDHKQSVPVSNKLWTTLEKTLLDLMPEQRLDPFSKNDNGIRRFDEKTQLCNAVDEVDQPFDFEADSNSEFEDIELEEKRSGKDEGEDFEKELELLHDTEEQID